MEFQYVCYVIIILSMKIIDFTVLTRVSLDSSVLKYTA